MQYNEKPVYIFVNKNSYKVCIGVEEAMIEFFSASMPRAENIRNIIAIVWYYPPTGRWLYTQTATDWM
jgi:hypothetical protein